MTPIRGDEGDNGDLLGWLDDDKIYGYGGNDVLDGFVGNDDLYGGKGHDALFGSDNNDELYGDDGNDILDGGSGSDLMRGGLGNDTYYVDDPRDDVAEYPYWYDDDGEIFEWAAGGIDTVIASIDYTLPFLFVENLTLASGSTATYAEGNEAHNVIIGNSNDNTLKGHSGNDTLDGGTGADTMIGGRDNDTYVVDNAGDVVVETRAGGIDTVKASVDFTLGQYVENLTLTGGATINGTGNALDNVMRGNGSANVLTGGLGNDTYHMGAGDTVVERAGEGTDLVVASVSHRLSANVEHLKLAEGSVPFNGTGNALNNTISGNDGDNTLDGSAGIDTLYGGDGRDELIGGAGSDTLTGGTGKDLFRFNRLIDGGDLITDYLPGQDHIALYHAGFGLLGTGSLASQGVDFIVGTKATSGNPTVIFNSVASEVWWDRDGSGAGSAQLLVDVLLPPLSTLSASDFIIV